MVSAILKTKSVHGRTTSYHNVCNNEIFGRLFCFVYISPGGHDIILIFSSKDTPSKGLHELYKKFPLENKKAFQTFLYYAQYREK
jgi:hypothetical protein